MTAEIEGEFVVFMIGMRINKLWKVRRWWPVVMAMRPMLVELSAHPELGMLAFHNAVGPRGPVVIQYWRSVELLNRFAKSADHVHLPAWGRFNRAIGNNGDVGIWHETYVVAPGAYETVYGNMPRHGLAAAGEHVPVARRGDGAADRLGKR
jgi:hypothetical protein